MTLDGAWLQDQLEAARPCGPDWSSSGAVYVSQPVEIWAPLYIPGGVHLLGSGRIRVKAMRPMPVMLYALADNVGNEYGSYMGGAARFTLDGNGFAEVGLQTGMVASYHFEQLRVVNCVDAAADLSQLNNSTVANCAFEHSGFGGGETAGGLRLSDGCSTNRFYGGTAANNWGAQIVFRDRHTVVADGAASPLSDEPAGKGGPSQNNFRDFIVEDYLGRSHRLVYGRAGQINRFDFTQFSHIRFGQAGGIDLVQLTSEDVIEPGLETNRWLFRDCGFHGAGVGYVGVRATRTWEVEVRRARWTNIPELIVKDQERAVLVTV